MIDFFASLGIIGWLILLLAAIAVAQLPRALRETFRRPWREDAPRSDADPRD